MDANLLIYAYCIRSPHYEATRKWLESVVLSEQNIGIPMQAVLAFVRVLTNPRLPGPGLSVGKAVAAIDSLLRVSTVGVLHPGPRHWEIFRRFCLGAGAGGNLSTDAHFAALAIEYDALLCSADSDYGRFPGLRWENPLPAS